MTPVLSSSEAEWVQPKTGKRYFELMAGGSSVMSLEFRSNDGSLANAECDSGSWTFKRVGFFNTLITVRAEGSDKDLAVFRPGTWGGGILTFPGGPSFAWKSANFWGTAWMFAGCDKPAVRFNSGIKDSKFKDIFKTQATVNVEPSEVDEEKILILLSLGIYLMVGQDDDAALVAAIAAIS
jgi:hypothetical protein